MSNQQLCPNGHHFRIGAKFCPTCGTPLSPPAPEKIQATLSNSSKANSQQADIATPHTTMIKNLLIRNQVDGRLLPVASIERDVTIGELLDAFRSEMGMIIEQELTLKRAATNKQLLSTKTIGEVGIQDGETLLVEVAYTAGGGIPVRSFRDIQLIEALVMNSEKLAGTRFQTLFAVFLYTDADTTLSDYIRKNVRELHEMSGEKCLFFVIEQPSEEWNIGIKKYLGNLDDIYSRIIEKRLGTNMYKPFDKIRAYEIAKKFNLEPKQLPCIILFRSLEDKNILTVELSRFLDYKDDTEQDYTDFFRCLFSYIQSSINTNSYTSLQKLATFLKADERRRKKKTSKDIETISMSVSVIEAIVSIIKSFI